jgi:hypothetical protein
VDGAANSAFHNRDVQHVTAQAPSAEEAVLAGVEALAVERRHGEVVGCTGFSGLGALPG